MAHQTLLELLPDRRRVCVMLRADGWSYAEIAAFLEIRVRQVRYELDHVSDDLSCILDHRRPENQNRLYRLAYLDGVADAGVPTEELTDWLDALTIRAQWLRARMRSTSLRRHGPPASPVSGPLRFRGDPRRGPNLRCAPEPAVALLPRPGIVLTALAGRPRPRYVSAVGKGYATVADGRTGGLGLSYAADRLALRFGNPMHAGRPHARG